MYKLSDFTDFVPYMTPRVVLDDSHDEVYVLFQNYIRVFNEYGMEVYSFGDDLRIGLIVDLAVKKDGNMVLLSWGEEGYRLVLCNYRGEAVSEMSIRNLPGEFSDFRPRRLISRNGNLYFATMNGFQVVVTDEEGNYKEGYDLAKLLDFTEQDVKDNDIVGFNVTKDGSLVFTIPTLFHVYKVSPDRKVNFFGKAGGPPGMFGIVAGVATDGMENYLIADKLKSIVHIFSKSAEYVTEFGYRTEAPGGLFSPSDVVVSSSNKVYVTQARKMGVSVFLLTYD